MNTSVCKRVLLILAAAGMPLFAQTGTLKTKVKPGSAGVFANGKYLGPAANFGSARSYQLAPGDYEIKLADPRYEEVVKKVTITAGKKAEIVETLKALPVPKPPFGYVRTQNTDKFAAVYVNEKFMGHVDEFSNPGQKLALPPGTYEVKIVPGSGSPITQKVNVQAEQTVIVK